MAHDVFYKALGRDYIHGSSAKEVLAALMERFGLVRENVTGQATSAASLLRSQTAKFDAIAVLFSQIPIDQDLRSAVDLVQGSSRSATPSTVHDFPKLVKLSMAHYNLRYAAAAYQLDFLALYLSALLNADYPTIREIRVQDAETESYKLLPSASFPDLRASRITLTEASLWFSRTGRIGLETNFVEDFLRYYIIKAERELKAGNVKGAVDALKSNTTYRGYSDNMLRAEILYAQSDFQGAMSAYRDAWQSDQFRYMLSFNPESYDFIQGFGLLDLIAAEISLYPFLKKHGYPGDPKKKKAWHDFLVETEAGRVARKEPQFGHCVDYERLGEYDRWVAGIIANGIRKGEW